MKNIFFICMFGLLAFAGCSDNEEEILTGGDRKSTRLNSSHAR